MTDKINLNVDITTLDVLQKIALWRRVKKLRLDTEKALSPVESLEKALKEALIADIPKSGDGVVIAGEDGRRRVVSVTSKPEPVIDDWTKFWDFASAQNRGDLIQKRLASTAVKDIDGWQKLPGIGTFNKLDISDALV